MKDADKRALEALEKAKKPTGVQRGNGFIGNPLLDKAGRALQASSNEDIRNRGKRMTGVAKVARMSGTRASDLTDRLQKEKSGLVKEVEALGGMKKGGMVRGCGIAKRGFGKAMKGK